MHEVPAYLLRTYRAISRAIGEMSTLERTEEPLIQATQEVTAEFTAWAADDEFWTATMEEFGTAAPTYDQVGTPPLN